MVLNEQHLHHGNAGHGGHEHHEDHSQHHSHAEHDMSSWSMAGSATLHCLTGCAIGEIAGLVIGTAAGWSNLATIVLAVALAFVFGFTLSTLPLLQAGLGFVKALGIVAVADTLSITTMEVVDNAVMWLIPGAMDAGLADPLYWVSMTVALAAAYFAALPVNKYLLARHKGHALTMQYHDHC